MKILCNILPIAVRPWVVATGNLEMIGWIKMERAGLREWFRFGGFSDQFPCSLRVDWRCSDGRRANWPDRDASVCVVGDTPRDIEAAHANGLPVIAVATGHFSFDELMEHKPEVCTTTLADLLESDTGAGMKKFRAKFVADVAAASDGSACGRAANAGRPARQAPRSLAPAPRSQAEGH